MKAQFEERQKLYERYELTPIDPIDRALATERAALIELKRIRKALERQREGSEPLLSVPPAIPTEIPMLPRERASPQSERAERAMRRMWPPRGLPPNDGRSADAVWRDVIAESELVREGKELRLGLPSYKVVRELLKALRKARAERAS